jgi:RNA-directed DNA polymerase
VKKHYFARKGSRAWVFHATLKTDGGNVVVQLHRTATTKIMVHRKVDGALNPFLPEWEPQLEERARLKMISKLSLRKRLASIWVSQDGKCPVCEQSIAFDEVFHTHHIQPKHLGGTDKRSNLVILHGELPYAGPFWTR